MRLIRDKDRAVISITDRGPGIDPEDVTHIFDRYYRGRNTSGSYGFGLGLYIAKQSAEAHEGKVYVKSKLREGSTFYISLPLILNTVV